MNDDLFNEQNAVKVKYNTLKFGKVGDWFRGTLTDNTGRMPNQLSPKKELQTIFEFKADSGSFHNIVKKQVDANPTTPVKGEFWTFISSKPSILNQFKDAKIGQVVGLKFTGIKEAKQAGFDDAKLITVYLGNMDPEYQGETARDGQAA